MQNYQKYCRFRKPLVWRFQQQQVICKRNRDFYNRVATNCT